MPKLTRSSEMIFNPMRYAGFFLQIRIQKFNFQWISFCFICVTNRNLEWKLTGNQTCSSKNNLLLNWSFISSYSDSFQMYLPRIVSSPYQNNIHVSIYERIIDQFEQVIEKCVTCSYCILVQLFVCAVILVYVVFWLLLYR